MNSIIKKNNGFTMIELLSVITILSVVMSIGIYVALDVVTKSKEKSYQTTIANIENGAIKYVGENLERLFYIDIGDKEYQCVSVNDLVETGYLSAKIADSYISKEEKALLSDYIYIERDKKTRTIIKSQYKQHNELCNYGANGDIIFSVNPDNEKWSLSKDVTITYKVHNRVIGDIYTYNHIVTDENNNTSTSSYTSTPKTIHNIISPSTINANITVNGKVLVEKTIYVSKIDRYGPTITIINPPESSVKTKNYNGSVKIPLKIVDINPITGASQSGVNENTITKEAFEVTIGGISPMEYKLNKINGSEYNYELEINDNIHTGELIITIPKGKILDNIDNENEKVEYKELTMNMVYQLLDSEGTHQGYTLTLKQALDKVLDNWSIKTLEDNTSTDNAINRHSNITLITNEHTITVEKAITNDTGKSLIVDGKGTMISLSSVAIFTNNGILTTKNITLSNNENDNEISYIINNSGIYNADNETKLISSNGKGILINQGTVNMNTNSSIEVKKESIEFPNTSSIDASLNINGAAIKSNLSTAILVSGNAKIIMNSGTITAGDESHPYNAIISQGKGKKKIYLIGGSVQAFGQYGIYASHSDGSTLITIGKNDGSVSLYPKIIGKALGVKTLGVASWEWYDGELYGNSKNGNYSPLASKIESEHYPITEYVNNSPYHDVNYVSYLSPEYIITLNNRGATNNPTTSVNTTYNSKTITPNTIVLPEKEYTIGGWGLSLTRNSDNANVSNTSTLTATYTFNGWFNNDEIKIISKEATPSFVHNVNGWTGTDGEWKRKSNETLIANYTPASVTLPKITKLGGYICGWTTEETGKTIMYQSSETITPTQDMTLFGVCEVSNTAYIVRFDANGGTGKMSDQQFAYNEEKALTANTFTKENYRFVKWNTRKDGTGTSYNNQKVVKNLTRIYGDIITLYAQWQGADINYSCSVGELTYNEELGGYVCITDASNNFNFDDWEMPGYGKTCTDNIMVENTGVSCFGTDGAVTDNSDKCYPQMGGEMSICGQTLNECTSGISDKIRYQIAKECGGYANMPSSTINFDMCPDGFMPNKNIQKCYKAATLN